MSINSIFSFLLPKENKFFPQIQLMGDELVKASNLFVNLIKEPDKTKWHDTYVQIKASETFGDKIINTIFDELNNTFVSPFDREDIHELCETLDDVMDFINSSSKRVALYQPKLIPTKANRMAEIINEGCLAIQIALAELKTINKKPAVALEQCGKLHDLEHEGDDVYELFVKELFEEEQNSIELIKTKEIMQEMEKTTDKANAVGKILKTIIVKYA